MSAWIDSHEKPASFEEVLIYHYLGDTVRKEVPQAMDVAYWDGEEWMMLWDAGRAGIVTHWMRLPKAPS